MIRQSGSRLRDAASSLSFKRVAVLTAAVDDGEDTGSSRWRGCHIWAGHEAGLGFAEGDPPNLSMASYAQEGDVLQPGDVPRPGLGLIAESGRAPSSAPPGHGPQPPIELAATSTVDRADPEDVRARLYPYHTMLRREIEGFGGTVEKFIGDAVMAVFSTQITHE